MMFVSSEPSLVNMDGEATGNVSISPFLANHVHLMRKNWLQAEALAHSVADLRRRRPYFSDVDKLIQIQITTYEHIFVCFPGASIRAAGAQNVHSIGNHSMATDKRKRMLPVACVVCVVR